MEFKDIEYAFAIAKYNNITKAAESLYITQPTLSTYIKNMEKRLGITMFKREGNKIDLTYEGEIFLESGLKILQERDNLLNTLNESLDSERGRLKLSIPILRGSYLIPLILPVFHKKYPNVHIVLSENNSSEIEENIKTGISDLGIFYKPFHKIALHYEIIHQEEMLLVMHKNHILSKEIKKIEGMKYPWIDIGLCKDEPFIIHTSSQHIGQVERGIFAQANVDANIVLETKNSEASLRLAGLNYGLTFIPESHIKYISCKQDLIFLSVGVPNTTMDLIAAYANGDYLSKYAREFITISKECLQQEKSLTNYTTLMSSRSSFSNPAI